MALPDAGEEAAIFTPGVPSLQAAPLSILLAVNVVHEDARSRHRHRQPFRPLERALGILVAALPVLAHGRAGEFVVLGVPFVGLLLINDVQDRDLGQMRELVLETALLLGE